MTTNNPGEKGGRIHLCRLDDGTYAIVESFLCRECVGAGYYHSIRRYSVQNLIGSGWSMQQLSDRFEAEYQSRK